MGAENLNARLKFTLTEMSAQASQLARIISEEGEALRSGDIEQLNAQVKSKQRSVVFLTTLDQDLKSILTESGCAADVDIETFLLNTDSNKELSLLWEQYLQHITDCSHHNNENNSLITIGIKHTIKALEFLHSCVGENNEMTYNSDGQQLSSTHNTSIAKV